MGKRPLKPQLIPPVRFWYEDEPRGDDQRATPMRGNLSTFGNLKHIDQISLQISRTDALIRGVGVLGCLLSLGGYLVLAIFSGPYDDAFMVGLCAASHIFLICALWFFRIDFLTPTDTPIRFNRKRGKVYIYEHARRWNPFVRWPTTIKIFDWNRVHAEITRQAGTNGTVYAVRYALFMSQCKPGTLEVEDRVQLGGVTTDEVYMQSLWDYCRLYMAQGPATLPPEPIRPNDINFRRCLFFFLPALDPSSEGRETRRHLGFFGWAVTVLYLPFFWLFLPLGLMRYAALKLAPTPKWPPDIDSESRSAPAN